MASEAVHKIPNKNRVCLVLCLGVRIKGIKLLHIGVRLRGQNLPKLCFLEQQNPT
jgi:hypothetical protein